MREFMMLSCMSGCGDPSGHATQHHEFPHDRARGPAQRPLATGGRSTLSRYGFECREPAGGDAIRDPGGPDPSQPPTPSPAPGIPFPPRPPNATVFEFTPAHATPPAPP